jgi:hypothetical protein
MHKELIFLCLISSCIQNSKLYWIFSQRKLRKLEHFFLSTSKGEDAFMRKDYVNAIRWYTEVSFADSIYISPHNFLPVLLLLLLFFFFYIYIYLNCLTFWLKSQAVDTEAALLSSQTFLVEAFILTNRSLCWAHLNEGDLALRDAIGSRMVLPSLPKAHYAEGVAWNLSKVSRSSPSSVFLYHRKKWFVSDHSSSQDFKRAAESFLTGMRLDRKNRQLNDLFRYTDCHSHTVDFLFKIFSP